MRVQRLVLGSVFVYVFFFFFQAEDGIRDKLVTGVQTCALPIADVARGVEARLGVEHASAREHEIVRLGCVPRREARRRAEQGRERAGGGETTARPGRIPAGRAAACPPAPRRSAPATAHPAPPP